MVFLIVYIVGLVPAFVLCSKFDYLFINETQKLISRETAIILWPFTISLFLLFEVLWWISRPFEKAANKIRELYLKSAEYFRNKK